MKPLSILNISQTQKAERQILTMTVLSRRGASCFPSLSSLHSHSTLLGKSSWCMGQKVSKRKRSSSLYPLLKVVRDLAQLQPLQVGGEVIYVN